MARRETSSEIDDAAADWLARMDRAPLSDVDRLLFQAWIDGDVRRRGAFARAKAVMAHADRARALRSGAVVLDQDMPVRAPSTSRRDLFWGVAAAASVAGIAVLGGTALLQPRRLSTAKGEVRRVPLPDGSSVTLNTASIIRVAYSDRARNIELVQGEALFDVAKDRTRPFVVRAGEMEVKAVGTSFTVHRQQDGAVRVLVREGVVEVRHGPAAPTVRVAANVMAVAPTPTAAQGAPVVKTVAVGPSDVARGIAWRDGLLSFDGDTLQNAALQFERYSDKRIVIDDPGLAHSTITGLFSANDPEGFAKAAAVSFGSRVTVQGDEVHLSR